MAYKVSSKKRQITVKIDDKDTDKKFKEANIINLKEQIKYKEFMREKYIYTEKTGDSYSIDGELYILYKEIKKDDRITYIFKALSEYQKINRGRPKKEDVM